MKRFFPCLFAFLPALSGWAQSWSAGAAIPEPVRAGNTAAYAKDGDGWLFVISGRNQLEAISKKVQRYQLSTDTWTEMAAHPTGLLGGATAVLNDSLYVAGGVVNPPGSGSNKLYRYNIDADSWSQAANLPYGLVDAKAVAYQDSLLYVAGGIGGPNTGKVLLYNAKTDTWRPATPFLPAGSRSFGGFAVTGDTLLYLCGTDGFLSPFYFDKVYVGVISQTDRAQISWTLGAPFPGATRTFFDAHTWQNGIIMTGGSTDNTFNTSSDECYAYDAGANTWTELPPKPVAWLTGQSGSVRLGDEWRLICTSGYADAYLTQTEIFSSAPAASGAGDETFCGTPNGLYNFPNPFAEQTTIRYCLRQEGRIGLGLYDAFGRRVRVLADGAHAPGEHVLSFEAGEMPAGVYYAILEKGPARVVQKMVIIR